MIESEWENQQQIEVHCVLNTLLTGRVLAIGSCLQRAYSLLRERQVVTKNN